MLVSLMVKVLGHRTVKVMGADKCVPHSMKFDFILKVTEPIADDES